MVNLVFQSNDEQSELIAHKNNVGDIFIEIASAYGSSEWILLDTETATALVKHLKSEIKQAKEVQLFEQLLEISEINKIEEVNNG